LLLVREAPKRQNGRGCDVSTKTSGRSFRVPYLPPRLYLP